MARTIELDDDPKFQRRSKIVERVGWGLMVVFLIASGAGFLGPARFESPIVSSLVVYFFLLVLVRVAGKRTLGEMNTFDFILLLIVSEACQEALIGGDDSVLGALTAITTLIGADIALSVLGKKSKTIDKWMEGKPSLLIENGRFHRKEIESARLDEEDIREAARTQLGLSKLSQIRHAVLEKDGSISVIPWRDDPKMSPAT